MMLNWPFETTGPIASLPADAHGDLLGGLGRGDRLVHPRFGTSMRDGRAGLARIAHHVGHAGATLSAKPASSSTIQGLLPPSSGSTRLTVGAAFWHLDADRVGAGERDHVDVGVPRQRHADAGALALDQVEHTGRHAGGIEDLGEDLRRVAARAPAASGSSCSPSPAPG